jgi:tRNA modification GTPase
VNHPDDTIAAIASAPGGAARGIVRISGPGTVDTLAACFQSTHGEDLRSIATASAIDGTITIGRSLGTLPATAYFWPDQRSYTRQPAAEIHTIGSPPLLSAVLDTLCSHGARLAEPGEFTLRAFFAGRLDLTQAEAVLRVIDARGEHDLRLALDQLAGGLTRPLHQLRESLLDLLAHLEAGLDFVEEDIEFVGRRELAAQLDAAAELLDRTLAQLLTRRLTDDLPQVALVGWPNVGKSSLFNALAGDSAALVSDESGTTRDYLTATVELNGLRAELVDTAGHEPEGEDETIQQAAQKLAEKAVAECDVELFCLDSSRPLNAWERARLSSPPEFLRRLVVATKTDQLAKEFDVGCQFRSMLAETSATSGAGLEDLRQRLHEVLVELADGDAAGSSTAQRCVGSLRAAQEAIEHARHLTARAGGEELIAGELRLALAELGKVVGAIYTDDILDRVFSRFCIGK